jgi:flagellar basal body P-ring protein FlgI
VVISSHAGDLAAAAVLRYRSHRVGKQSDIKVQSDKGQLVLCRPRQLERSGQERSIAVGATPIDLLAILQAMKAAGR